MMQDISVKGAREHNLKNIDITLPRNRFIVITGLSGSGKSTLAFDTIYAEGQRRYVESLSAYARQFLGLMNKPDVDSIEGLSPAISIEQKSTSRNPRSTVGTITEIYDYLRLLFARIGTPHCPQCGKIIKPQSTDSIVHSILKHQGKRAMILSPVIRGKKGTYEKLFEDFKKDGYVRARVDGAFYSLETDKIKLDKYVKHNIEAVIARLSVDAKDRTRLQDAVETALKLGNGFVIAMIETERDKFDEKLYSQHLACSECGVNFEELQPRMFSFNSPFGACESCHGLGEMKDFDVDLLIPDKELSIADGALLPWKNAATTWRAQILNVVGKRYGFDMLMPIKKFSKKQLQILLYGSEGEEMQFKFKSKSSDSSWNWTGKYEGLIPSLRKKYEQGSEKDQTKLEEWMGSRRCEACNGKRLSPTSLAVKIKDKNIIDVTDMSILECSKFFTDIELSEKEKMISKQVLKEIRTRLSFLVNVGLDYLTLSRAAGTLSGGEAQRIRLATQIGSNLMGVLYILDEPSIGLHQRDNQKLINTLQSLRDVGNTLIVVEHDEDTIQAADYVVDIGPGAGIHGGQIVASGTPKQIMANKNSITGEYLSGKRKIEIPDQRRKPEHFLTVKGCKENNLKNIDAKIPLGVFCAITGVSGSGKSTLINHILCKGLMKKINGSSTRPGNFEGFVGDDQIDNIIVIDQSPIGRTPRSNPATYTGVFADIRELFASTKDAKMRGYDAGRFSFNVNGGRCDECEGDGQIKIEMNFLPDVYVTCEECKGKRYNEETLAVRYKEKNIADVLEMSVEEALAFFENVPRIARKIQTLSDVGLGYIKLGQSATTLSGGEAQRVKLTSELAKRGTGKTLYILDEPTTGLHFEDIRKLLEVLNRLVEKGNSIVVIEHNLDVIKTADYILDLGPEGGARGGRIIAQGTPEQVAQAKGSFTGEFLKKILESKAKQISLKT